MRGRVLRARSSNLFLCDYQKVTIDVCKVFGEETVFLQQAAHLTGGSYIYLQRRDGFLQYLMVCSPGSIIVPTQHSLLQMSFLPPPSLRHIIAVPRQDKVDFRASCFCHKNIVDIGFVCSVCLSSELASTFNRSVFIPVSWPSILLPRASLLDLQVRYCRRCLAAS
jgi:hypothetical protein